MMKNEGVGKNKEKNKEKNKVVEIKNLAIEYATLRSTVKAVNGIDLTLYEGDTLGLVGETGAGKTTAMLSLMGLIPDPPGVIRDGEILVNGRDIRLLSDKELGAVRGNEISMIFQDPMTSLNPVMTVAEQIEESILLHERISRKEAFRKTLELLAMVGIDPQRAHEYPHQFSGGMRQRVMIAIALSCRPSILIADEPTTALDVTIQAQVLRLMKQLKAERGMSMIMITHDLGVVAEVCDYVAVMYAGRIVEQGTLEDVFNRTAHPYTEGLFNSLPNIHNRVHKLQPIKGLMPDPSCLPQGCAFAERCPYATEACGKLQPEPHALSATHTAACIRYREPEFRIKRGDHYE